MDLCSICSSVKLPPFFVVVVVVVVVVVAVVAVVLFFFFVSDLAPPRQSVIASPVSKHQTVAKNQWTYGPSGCCLKPNTNPFSSCNRHL